MGRDSSDNRSDPKAYYEFEEPFFSLSEEATEEEKDNRVKNIAEESRMGFHLRIILYAIVAWWLVTFLHKHWDSILHWFG